MRRQHHVIIGIVIAVRGAFVQIEIFPRGVERCHRRQRADRLTVFYALVEPFSRFGITGVCKDRAMAKRPRPGFGRPLIQRDDAVLRHHERHQVGDGVAAIRRRYIPDPG